MHTHLTQLREELIRCVDDIQVRVPNDKPINQQYGAWGAPSVTRQTLMSAFRSVVNRIDAIDSDGDVPASIEQIPGYTAALSYLRTNASQHLVNSNAITAVSGYLLSAYALSDVLSAFWPEHYQVEADAASQGLKQAKTRIRAVESVLLNLEPKTSSLATMVERIESAHEVADQLPTVLDDLTEARNSIVKLADVAEKAHISSLAEAEKHKLAIADLVSKAESFVMELSVNESKGESLVKQLKDLHRIGTSTVLAGAFHTRATKLNTSVYIWLAVLMVALGAAWYIGHERAAILTKLLEGNASGAALSVQAVMMIVSMGAPVWLGWVATKQISQRFKLAEDYQYKASISNAYEGYRREAVEIDDEFRRKLFSSALDRLDEQPLRVMDIENHGSPVHEIMHRPGFWNFMIQVFGRNNQEASKKPGNVLPEPNTEKSASE